jgi:hypothetical protein
MLLDAEVRVLPPQSQSGLQRLTYEGRPTVRSDRAVTRSGVGGRIGHPPSSTTATTPAKWLRSASLEQPKPSFGQQPKVSTGVPRPDAAKASGSVKLNTISLLTSELRDNDRVIKHDSVAKPTSYEGV